MFGQKIFTRKLYRLDLPGKFQGLLGDLAELLALALFIGFIAMLANGLSAPLPV